MELLVVELFVELVVREIELLLDLMELLLVDLLLLEILELLY